MATLSPDVAAALATLRTRWGAAAPARFGEGVGGVMGALATVPLEAPDVEPDVDGRVLGRPDPAATFSTGFPALDAILGPGGLPRGMGLSLRGDLSSGRTTLALRLAAEAQAGGAIVAWLDLAAAFDPVEAVARGVRPEWLVVATPGDVEEGLSIAGALLSGRTVDLLVIDLPQRLDARMPGPGRGVAARLGRLAALARRAGISLAVLEPPGLAAVVSSAIGEATGIRLELVRRSWIRLGRDVVGQRTEVAVARNRAGPPGRRTTLRILYADGGERDDCLRREDLLRETGGSTSSSGLVGLPIQAPAIAPIPVPGTWTDATPAPLSPPPPPRPRQAAPALRLVAGGTDRPRRQAMDRGTRPRRRSGRPGAGHPARNATRHGSPARARGGLPRSRPGG